MLKIKNLKLENFRGFEKLDIEFNDRMTCFVGVNGAGKSSLLRAISKSMSLLVNKASLTSKKEYSLVSDDVRKIENDALYNFMGEAKINATFLYNDKDYKTTNCIQVRGDTKSIAGTNADICSFLDDSELPVLSFYVATRTIGNIESQLKDISPISDPFYLYKNIETAVSSYEDFFSWFKRREDIENERIVLAKENRGINDYRDVQLEIVRDVISNFLGEKEGYKLRVSRQENTLYIRKGNAQISFENLSDGEKAVILLLGDIARKLAITTSYKFKDLPTTINDIRNGDGIILIDEIDLHLHPSWQRKICGFLKDYFPKCQFIITTHSPQVLGELKTEEIWLLNDFNVYRPDSSYGLTSNEILDEMMDVIDDDVLLSRDGNISKKVQELNLLVELGKIEEAKKLIFEIEKEAGNELHDVNACKIAIEMMESE